MNTLIKIFALLALCMAIATVYAANEAQDAAAVEVRLLYISGGKIWTAFSCNLAQFSA